MQIIFFGLVALVAVLLNLMTAQGFFNVSDRFFWKQTSNLLSKRQPIKLEIKPARISSSVERVGIDKEGNMQAPSSAKIISWYQFGALSGEKGNMVLSGHKDSTIGPGVFYTLGNVKPGDVITVTAADKTVYTYLVNHSKEYKSEDLPVREIFADQKKSKQIFLITCAGSFDIFKKKYDKRVLVGGVAE
ncbi:MAG: class F sortase [bacterium]|nr:class F sortase [bacterium]